MEPKQIRSIVIANLVGFSEQRQPVQKQHKFLSDGPQSKAAKLSAWSDKCLSIKEQYEIRDNSVSETCKRAKQLKGSVQDRNKCSSSGFVLASPTKELFHAYLQPSPLSSKHIIDAHAAPPHRRKKSMKSTDFSVFGKVENNGSKFGRRIDRRNLNSKSKLKHHNSVDPLKVRFRKKETSLKRSVSGETPNSIFSAPRHSMLSPGQVAYETPIPETRLKLISAPSFSKKDENYDFECTTTSEEAYQPSPVSVLEPFLDGEVFEDLREPPYLNLHDLEQQLETLKSESIETCSQGSGMVVSSDEESDEDSVLDLKAKDGKSREEVVDSVGSLGSREFTYVNTILSEVGFYETKQVSFDLPIDIIIFEKLEKKYGKQTSWKRSERRLLFDRVNSSLVEIQESTRFVLTWKKHVSRRLSIMLSIRSLKQEIQRLLARQEKQAKIEASTKVLLVIDDKWLELEEETESVVRELETMLEDELMAEVVGLE